MEVRSSQHMVKGSAARVTDQTDFSRLARDLVRSLREPLSQAQASRQLGYSFNKLHRLESGLNAVKWGDIVDLCDLAGIDLSQAFFDVYVIKIEDPRDTKTLLLRLLPLLTGGDYRAADIARVVNVHPSVARRWLHGDVAPDFEKILALLYYYTQQTMVAWLRHILGHRPFPESQGLFRDVDTSRRVETSYPYACAVEAVFWLESYQQLEVHSDEFVAEKTRLPLAVVKELLPVLVAAKQIEFVDGKYRTLHTTVNLNGASRREFLTMAKYWNDRTRLWLGYGDQSPLNRGGNPNTLVYRIVPTSKEAASKITEILVRANAEILAAVEQDKGPVTEIRAFLAYHFGVDDIETIHY
ncbi:MAG: helix-turn-helix domain-containing protein [Bdellovibrionaceae bacterium]|nr:helix-turn-helix domain-containing protein [Pseudobdellovibrionaceae bacterium]